MSNSFYRYNGADQDKKLDAEKLTLEDYEVYRQRVMLAPNALRLVVSGDSTYIGEAPPGTADATAAWRIKKLLTSGGNLSILWAEGTSDFVHAWTNYSSLSYS